MKLTSRTMRLDEAVETAHDNLVSLGEECRETFDNLPENFQSGEKGQRLEEAADTLESLDEVEVPEWLQAREVVLRVPDLTPAQQAKRSKADRRSDNTMILEQIIEKVEALGSEDNENFLSDLQNLLDAAEGVL